MAKNGLPLVLVFALMVHSSGEQVDSCSVGETSCLASGVSGRSTDRDTSLFQRQKVIVADQLNVNECEDAELSFLKVDSIVNDLNSRDKLSTDKLVQAGDTILNRNHEGLLEAISTILLEVDLSEALHTVEVITELDLRLIAACEHVHVSENDTPPEEARTHATILARAPGWLGKTLWEGTIDVCFDQTCGHQCQEVVEKAVDQITSQVPCLSMRTQGSSTHGCDIKVQGGNGNPGCWSWLGKMDWSPQELNLGPGCVWIGIAVHEFLHALGVEHEQKRTDRDDIISVNYENIRDDRHGQFDKGNAFIGSHYDILSVMHYGSHGFSKNGKPTIEVKGKPELNRRMGQRMGMSQLDAVQVCMMYGCKDTCKPKMQNYEELLALLYTNEGCNGGYAPIVGDIPGWGRINGKGGGQQVADCQVCAGLCDDEPRCGSYECFPSHHMPLCNLNSMAEPTHGPYTDEVFCQKPGAWGEFVESQVDNDPADPHCWFGSFTTPTCSKQFDGKFYYTNALQVGGGDAVFLVGECEGGWRHGAQTRTSKKITCQRAACASGFSALIGNIWSGGSVNGKGGGAHVAQCQGCADLCSEEAGCASYMCSHTTKTCWLYKEKEPSHGPVNDYFFCQKVSVGSSRISWEFVQSKIDAVPPDPHCWFGHFKYPTCSEANEGKVYFANQYEIGGGDAQSLLSNRCQNGWRNGAMARSTKKLICQRSSR